MSDEPRYQMLWDCAFCGQKALLGVTHRHCPTCGAGQDPARRYFPEPGKEVAVEGHPFVGADKVCGHCRHPNSAKAAHCTECGAALDQAAAAKTHTDDGVRSAQERINKERAAARASTGEVPPPVPARPRARSRAKPIVFGLLAVLVAFVAFYALYQREAKATVQEHAWKRDVQLEVFRELDEKSDCSSKPGDARVYDRHADRRTRRVQDGESCRQACSNERVDLGDGSFKTQRNCHDECTPKYRDEAYYVDVCRYKIDRWVKGRLVTAEGRGQEAAWPAVDLATGGGRGYGKEREKERTASYKVILRAEGKALACEYRDETPWRALAQGKSVTVKLDLFGKPDCAALAKAAR